jgi:hypothetical protein
MRILLSVLLAFILSVTACQRGPRTAPVFNLEEVAVECGPPDATGSATCVLRAKVVTGLPRDALVVLEVMRGDQVVSRAVADVIDGSGPFTGSAPLAQGAGRLDLRVLGFVATSPDVEVGLESHEARCEPAAAQGPQACRATGRLRARGMDSSLVVVEVRQASGARHWIVTRLKDGQGTFDLTWSSDPVGGAPDPITEVTIPGFVARAPAQ